MERNLRPAAPDDVDAARRTLSCGVTCFADDVDDEIVDASGDANPRTATRDRAPARSYPDGGFWRRVDERALSASRGPKPNGAPVPLDVEKLADDPREAAFSLWRLDDYVSRSGRWEKISDPRSLVAEPIAPSVRLDRVPAEPERALGCDGTERFLAVVMRIARTITKSRERESRERERELARRAEAGDFRARRDLIESGLPSAVATARAYEHRGLDRGELIAVAAIGLCEGVARYDWRRGTRLTTYARFWIRRAIFAAFAEKRHHVAETITLATVELPASDDVEGQVIARDRLRRALVALTAVSERERIAYLLDADGVPQAEIAARLGVTSVRRVRQLRDGARVSLRDALAEAA